MKIVFQVSCWERRCNNHKRNRGGTYVSFELITQALLIVSFIKSRMMLTYILSIYSNLIITQFVWCPFLTTNLIIYYLKHMCPIKRSDHFIRPTHLTSLSIVKFIPITNSIQKMQGSGVLHRRSMLGDYWAQLVKILVSPSPTRYML